MSVSRWSWWNPRSNLFWKSTTTRQAPAVHICRLRLKLASYFHAGFELEKTMWNGSITPWSNCLWGNQASGPTIVQNKKRWTIRQSGRYYRWNNFIVFLPVELGGYFYPPFFCAWTYFLSQARGLLALPASNARGHTIRSALITMLLMISSPVELRPLIQLPLLSGLGHTANLEPWITFSYYYLLIRNKLTLLKDEIWASLMIVKMLLKINLRMILNYNSK